MTSTKGISEMQLSHRRRVVSAVFDEPNLVSAGTRRRSCCTNRARAPAGVRAPRATQVRRTNPRRPQCTRNGGPIVSGNTRRLRFGEGDLASVPAANLDPTATPARQTGEQQSLTQGKAAWAALGTTTTRHRCPTTLDPAAPGLPDPVAADGGPGVSGRC